MSRVSVCLRVAACAPAVPRRRSALALLPRLAGRREECGLLNLELERLGGFFHPLAEPLVLDLDQDTVLHLVIGTGDQVFQTEDIKTVWLAHRIADVAFLHTEDNGLYILGHFVTALHGSEIAILFGGGRVFHI